MHTYRAAAAFASDFAQMHYAVLTLNTHAYMKKYVCIYTHIYVYIYTHACIHTEQQQLSLQILRKCIMPFLL